MTKKETFIENCKNYYQNKINKPIAKIEVLECDGEVDACVINNNYLVRLIQSNCSSCMRNHNWRLSGTKNKGYIIQSKYYRKTIEVIEF